MNISFFWCEMTWQSYDLKDLMFDFKNIFFYEKFEFKIRYVGVTSNEFQCINGWGKYPNELVWQYRINYKEWYYKHN